ncbi:hypothetical protein C0992_005815 [Termitomyces sp. T32_za158]|nr:hypothetical protein C0992_005815 [Termitomyces sp. T32_za158]
MVYWVPLNIDGVVRGDLYLEMTFYSNAPAPNSTLSASFHAVPLNNFQRRPSKLEKVNHPLPADPQPKASSTRPLQPGRHPSGSLAPEPRQQSTPAQHTPAVSASDRVTTVALQHLLSDSPTGQQPPNNVYLTSKSHHSRSPSPSSSKRVDAPLPTLPHQASPPSGLPSTLLPGRGRPRTPSHTYTPPELPSTLRARVGRAVSSPTSQYTSAQSQQIFVGPSGSLAQHNDVSSSKVSHTKAYTLGPTSHILSTSNSHLTPGPILSPPLPSNSTVIEPPYVAPVSPSLTQWRPEAASTESFSFPVPMIAPATGELSNQESYAPQTSYTYSPPPASYAPPPVEANYTYTPPQAGYALPPPLLGYPSKSVYPQPSYPSQPTIHNWHQPSFQDSSSDPLLQVRYSTPLPLPPGSGTPSRGQQSGSSVTASGPDKTRIEALRGVEKEVERRKTQEEKDRELALALDRELNLEG